MKEEQVKLKMIRKGMRLDELLKVDNPNLSMELYYYSFFDNKHHKNFNNNCGAIENLDIPDYKVYLFSNDAIDVRNLGKDFADYYNFDLDKFNKIFSSTQFYFYIIVKYFNKKIERIIVPNELFLTIDHARDRTLSIMRTDNFLKIKNYYEHH